MKKKSYNPFKMWGSWFGAILINIIPLPFCFFECGFISYYKFWAYNRAVGLGVTVVGFLIGWGIHSLIRRLKR